MSIESIALVLSFDKPKFSAHVNRIDCSGVIPCVFRFTWGTANRHLGHLQESQHLLQPIATFTKLHASIDAGDDMRIIY